MIPNGWKDSCITWYEILESIRRNKNKGIKMAVDDIVNNNPKRKYLILSETDSTTNSYESTYDWLKGL